MSHPPTHDDTFTEIAQLIATARQRAVQAVNTTLIELYWQVGATISHKIEAAEWGDGVVTQLADYLARTQPGLNGFTRRNLFRMRQFYEAYHGDEKVSALLTQLPWTHNLIILSQSQRPEEREFYLRMAVQEKWSSRELERQFNDLAVLRAQVSKLQEELSIARRIEWIRQGLFASGEQKGAQKLLQGFNALPSPAKPKPSYDLNVEVNADGSVKVIPPPTNGAPASLPAK